MKHPQSLICNAVEPTRGTLGSYTQSTLKRAHTHTHTNTHTHTHTGETHCMTNTDVVNRIYMIHTHTHTHTHTQRERLTHTPAKTFQLHRGYFIFISANLCCVSAVSIQAHLRGAGRGR